jgi:hypothetical protein
VEDIQFHIGTENQNDNVRNNRTATDSQSSYRIDVNILQVEAISFLEFAATLNENTYNLVQSFHFCYLIFYIILICNNDISIILSSFSYYIIFVVCSQNAQH